MISAFSEYKFYYEQNISTLKPKSESVLSPVIILACWETAFCYSSVTTLWSIQCLAWEGGLIEFRCRSLKTNVHHSHSLLWLTPSSIFLQLPRLHKTSLLLICTGSFDSIKNYKNVSRGLYPFNDSSFNSHDTKQSSSFLPERDRHRLMSSSN